MVCSWRLTGSFWLRLNLHLPFGITEGNRVITNHVCTFAYLFAPLRILQLSVTTQRCITIKKQMKKPHSGLCGREADSYHNTIKCFSLELKRRKGDIYISLPHGKYLSPRAQAALLRALVQVNPLHEEVCSPPHLCWRGARSLCVAETQRSRPMQGSGEQLTPLPCGARALPSRQPLSAPHSSDHSPAVFRNVFLSLSHRLSSVSSPVCLHSS